MRLALSVVFSSLAGYLLAAPQLNFNIFCSLLWEDIAWLAPPMPLAVLERDLDAQMERTKNVTACRRVHVPRALALAIFLTLAGICLLYLLNWRTAFLAAFLFFYTLPFTLPSKPAPLAVFVGAFRGPFPLCWVGWPTPTIWDRARGIVHVAFFWQFPHFWAAWMLDEDYKKAGFKIPTGERPRNCLQIVVPVCGCC